MNMYKKTRGAVSVFLVMILVPCIVVTSLFVDLGRVHLTKSMATSASDLALNSLLTNYDADLKDWYGMVASCQNIDEFYEVSAQFFLRTVSSQGLSDEEIILLADYYANATNDDTIYDLLRVECKTAPSEMITAVDNADLANATIIKDQVVEFMKYRAPIQITENLINRLKNDESLGEANEAKINEPLVEKKETFYDAEGKLLEASLKTYVAIYDYFASARAYGLTNAKLSEYADNINSYKEVYEKIHTLMVKDLYNTSGLSTYSRPTRDIGSYSSSKEAIGYKVVDEETKEETYYISYETIKQLVGDLNTKNNQFWGKVQAFETAALSYVNNMPGTGDNDAYDIQWWQRMSGIASSNDICGSGNADAMLNAYAKVKAISDCTLDDTVPADWESASGASTAKSITEGYHSKYLTAGGNGDSSGTYIPAVKKLEEISSSRIGAINSSSVTVNVNGTNKTIATALTDIQAELTSMKSVLETHVEYLDIAIDGKGDVKSLDELLVLAQTYESSLDAWEITAGAMSTTMSDEDEKEIAEVKNPNADTNGEYVSGADMSEAVSPEKVTELKTRLTNIRSQLQNVISAIDSLKYGSKKLIEITTYDIFKKAAKNTVSTSNIGLTNKELNDYAKSTFSSLFAPTTEPTFTLSNLDNSKYNLEIDPKTKKVETPSLFIYMDSKFDGLDVTSVQEQKDALGDGEDTAKKAGEDAKNKERFDESSGGVDITKDFSGSATFSLTTGVFSGLLDLFNSLCTLNISSIRDDLYVTTYMMEMFSYATYENEGLYDLVEKKTELDLKNYSTEYKKVMGEADKEDNKGKWLSTEVTDSYNKSLTNKLINKTNNAAYQAEVEYILYGGTNKENVKAAYSTIYGIRYALNLVSGYANFWSSGKNTTAAVINTIAVTIQGLTGGIVPPPVTKIVLIPILTIFETAVDLDRLQAGFPVEIYKKDDEQWWLAINTNPKDFKSVGDFLGALTDFTHNNEDKGLFYSDYLTVFVYLGLKSTSDDTAKCMYERMAEVIQSNMRMHEGIKGYTQEVEGGGTQAYTLKNSKVYFKLESTMRTEPLMIALPIFNEYDNNLDTQTDWCTYKISTVRGYS